MGTAERRWRGIAPVNDAAPGQFKTEIWSHGVQIHSASKWVSRAWPVIRLNVIVAALAANPLYQHHAAYKRDAGPHTANSTRRL